MKRFLILVLTLAMILSMSACSSGKENKPNENPDKMSEKEFEEHFNELDKEIEAEENGSQANNGDEADNGNEADNGIDLSQPGIDLENYDAYELGVLKAFGLDNDFPKPKEGHEQKWRTFHSNPFDADPVTGDIREGVKSYYLLMRVDEGYTDYWNEVQMYIESKYDVSNIRYMNKGKTAVIYLDNDDCALYVNYPRANDNTLTMYYGYWEHRTIEGEVTGVPTYAGWKGELEGYPNKIEMETDDGDRVTIDYKTWAELDEEQMKLVQKYVDIEQFPEAGDRVRVDYMYYLPMAAQEDDPIFPADKCLIESLEIIE